MSFLAWRLLVQEMAAVAEMLGEYEGRAEALRRVLLAEEEATHDD